MERGQERSSAVGILFRFSRASVAFKNYRKYNCALFENATIVIITHYDAIITEWF